MLLGAILVHLGVCGGGSGSAWADPEDHLRSERFTTHQPQVLEQIGAHHAYARGLSGRGVRIGIHDDTVDFTQTEEFGRRVRLRAADGAVLAYWRPPGRQNSLDAARCLLDSQCTVYYIDSEGDDEALNRAVRDIVTQVGWPGFDDSVYIIDQHYSAFDPIGRLFRAWEVPAIHGNSYHGTVVASTAAGSRLGVAPGATIIPVAINLTDDQQDLFVLLEAVLSIVVSLPSGERARADEMEASALRNNYAQFDIINRSFGSAAAPNPVSDVLDAAAADRFLTQYLPRTRRALYQLDRAPGERTIIVYASGNESHDRPNLTAALPYYQQEVRGHHLAVAATDPDTRRIAYYSDRCGPLPADWDGVRHGPHFCLAAPGTVRGLAPNPSCPGRDGVGEGHTGTSFAAPVVSGALALMMEHFRGTKGNTEVVRRMLDTADRSGVYADSETYGAGHLDLEAALSPVGRLTAGQNQQALANTLLVTPTAFGSVAERTDDAEIASFDAQEFPFWVPVSDLVSARSDARSPIPDLDARDVGLTPAPGLEALGAHWIAARSQCRWRFR